MDNKQNFDINSKISEVINKCNDVQIYTDIMSLLFSKGIFRACDYIKSLNILPNLNHKEIQSNFVRNVTKIVSYIKTGVKPNTDLYKVLSCIYGAFLGDAMGAFCEFEKPDKKNSKYIFRNDHTVIGGAKGQVTDDSEMALSMAYAIMDNPQKEELIVDYLYFYYGAWYKTNPLDSGNTTDNALRLFDFKKFVPILGNFKNIETNIITLNFKSLSNGFLMRKTPFIAWLYYRFYQEISQTFSVINNNDSLLVLYNKIKNLTMPDNKCTNPNDQTNVVSSIYSLMALMAIFGLTANMIIDKICNLCKDPFSKIKEKKMNILLAIQF